MFAFFATSAAVCISGCSLCWFLFSLQDVQGFASASTSAGGYAVFARLQETTNWVNLWQTLTITFLEKAGIQWRWSRNMSVKLPCCQLKICIRHSLFHCLSYFLTPRHQRCTSLLLQLHWFPISKRIFVRACVCVRACGFCPLLLFWTTPALQRVFPTLHQAHAYSNSKASTATLLAFAFSHYGPYTWNNLRQDVRHFLPSKTELKTFLFSKHFHWATLLFIPNNEHNVRTLCCVHKFIIIKIKKKKKKKKKTEYFSRIGCSTTYTYTVGCGHSNTTARVTKQFLANFMNSFPRRSMSPYMKPSQHTWE